MNKLNNKITILKKSKKFVMSKKLIKIKLNESQWKYLIKIKKFNYLRILIRVIWFSVWYC